MKKFCRFLLLLFTTVFAFSVNAKENMVKRDIIFNEKNGEIFVEEVGVDELENLFFSVKYEDYIFMPNMLYPAIFLKKLPHDFDQIEDDSYRNRLFIKLLAPVAIKVSEDLFKEREKMLTMKEDFEKKSLSQEQSAQLEKWAETYDIFTPLKDNLRTKYIFDELKKKLDIIPPSMLIGAAAIESNWGTSRPAKEANSLYKEKLWYGQGKGLAPEVEDYEEDDDYEFKIFDSIYDAMMSYSIKINSGVDFYYMRSYRAEYRRRKRTISGRTLAHSMQFSSQLKNFAGLLDYTITFYEMQNLDYAKLLRLPK